MSEPRKQRNLGEVLDAMLVHVPVGHALREQFEWLAQDIRYKAPEQMYDCWLEATAMLSQTLGPPEGLTENWQKQVAAIFTDKPIDAPHTEERS